MKARTFIYYRLMTVILGLVVITSFILWLGLIYLARQTSLSTREITLAAENFLTSEEALKQNQEFLLAQTPFTKRIDGYFLKSSDILPFIQALEEAARRSGAQLEVSNAGIAESKEGQSLTLSIKTKGSFSSLVRFSSAVEALPFPLSIEFLEWRADSSGDGWLGAATVVVTGLNL
jgi:Tfp pilus assembly protein PilO